MQLLHTQCEQGALRGRWLLSRSIGASVCQAPLGACQHFRDRLWMSECVRRWRSADRPTDRSINTSKSFLTTQAPLYSHEQLWAGTDNRRVSLCPCPLMVSVITGRVVVYNVWLLPPNTSLISFHGYVCKYSGAVYAYWARFVSADSFSPRQR